MEGLIFGGAYLQKEIRVSKSIGLALFTVFALFYFVFEGYFPSTSPRGGLYLEGRFNGGFFALPVWGAYIWRGLFSEFYGNSQNDGMDDLQSTLLILFYLHHFPLPTAVSLLGELLKSLLFSLGFRVCVVFIHEKENKQRFRAFFYATINQWRSLFS